VSGYTVTGIGTEDWELDATTGYGIPRAYTGSSLLGVNLEAIGIVRDLESW
jgi:hypothetical protein